MAIMSTTSKPCIHIGSLLASAWKSCLLSEPASGRLGFLFISISAESGVVAYGAVGTARIIAVRIIVRWYASFMVFSATAAFAGW